MVAVTMQLAAVIAGPPTAASSPSKPGWERLGTVPSLDVDPDNAVWTGRELVIWDGGTGSAVAFDPATGASDRLPKSPLRPREAVVMAWTGREVIVWGGTPQATDCEGPTPYLDGAAYNPKTDTWRSIPDAPIAPRVSLGGVWTGNELIVSGGAASSLARTKSIESVRRDGAAYSPATNRWRRIPPAPVRITEGVVRWTGREMLVFGSLRTDYCKDGYLSSVHTVLYDPTTNRWRRLEDSRVSNVGPNAVVVAKQIVAWGRSESQVHALHGGSWRAAAPLHVPDVECASYGSVAGGNGDALFELCAHFWQYDARADTFTSVLAPPVPFSEQPIGEPIWTGDEFLFWQKNPWAPEGTTKYPTADASQKDLVVWSYVPERGQP
jgi:hypothetical protein